MASPAPSLSQVQTARSVSQRSGASGGASSSGRALNSSSQSSGQVMATHFQRHSLPLPLSKCIESVNTDIALPESQSQSAGASVRSSSGAPHRLAQQAAATKPGAHKTAADRSGAQVGAARSATQRNQLPGVQLRHSWAAPQQERPSGFSPSSGVARGRLANQGVRQGATAGAASNKVSADVGGLVVQRKAGMHKGHVAGALHGSDGCLMEAGLYAVVVEAAYCLWLLCIFCQETKEGTAARRLCASLDLAVPNNMLCPRRRMHQHRSEGASWTRHATMPRQQQTLQQLWIRRRCRHKQQRELASH